MEKIQKKISLENYQRYIEEMSFFGWETVRVEKDNEYAHIEMSRDEKMENYEKLNELQKKWFSYTYPPFWPMAVLTGVAFALITSLLVLWVFLKDNFDAIFWLLCLGLPAFLAIALSVIWFNYRLKKMKKVLYDSNGERQKIKQDALMLLKDSQKDGTKDN